jgi:thioredoxin reductase (NADPH)
MLTTEVENFPGFPDGVMGPALMKDVRSQAQRFGADLVAERVSRVDFSSAPFGVWTGDSCGPEPTYTAKSVIIATGARALPLDVPNERELTGHGVSTCATCDGFFFRDQQIAVVGGGDSALEEAVFLSRFASSVTVIHRRDTLRASKIMQSRAAANPKLRMMWNSAVIEALEKDGRLAGVRVAEVTTGSDEVLDVTGLFVAIGHRPNTDLFAGQIEMNDHGYIATQGRSTRTSVTGVFACGDVQDDAYRQAVTAAGSGCMAALDVERYLADQEELTNRC